jgi:CSLREA domain-containing protein
MNVRNCMIMLAALCCGSFGSVVLHATEIHVKTLVDGAASSGSCSLREAIQAANTDTAIGACQKGSGADTIVFDVGGTISLSDTLPAISSEITINGARAITLDGNHKVRILYVNIGASLHLIALTLQNGVEPESGDGGGAVHNEGVATVSECTFTGNTAKHFGGAVSNGRLDISGGGKGHLTVDKSTFSRNAVEGWGGAIASIGSVANINGSTFAGNSTANQGAAVYNQPDSASDGEVAITNSTFSANSTNNEGAAITSYGKLSLNNSTINGSIGPFAQRAGTAVANHGMLTLANTIIANNFGIGCGNYATITAVGVNLIDDGSCAVPGALSGDPLLAELADNGGPTMTHALKAGSIAIDAASSGPCPAADQRGQARPFDGNHDGIAVCDIGAEEAVILFPFSGFLPPVSNPPIVNVANAGRAVPINFSLGRNWGLNIFAPGYPKSQQTVCASQSPVADMTDTTTSGASMLSFDSVSNTYTYVWKTDRSWAGTCRQFVMQLNDGTFHLANFQFR